MINVKTCIEHKLYTLLDGFTDNTPRDWQNYIDISGYHFKRISVITILEKNNRNNIIVIGVSVINV